MARRETTTALVATVVAALAIVLTIGGMISSGHHVGKNVRVRHEHATPVPERVPVICYHYLRGASSPLRLLRVFGYVVLSLPLLDDSELWTTSASTFERQMQYLKERGYHTVSLSDVHEWQTGMRELPPKAVVLTFDDADESVYEYAYPVLKRFGMRATLFVVTGHAGRQWGEVRCLDWLRLREMQESGVFDIESHTHDMHYKIRGERGPLPVFLAGSEQGRAVDGRDWREAVRDDLTQSYRSILRHVGRAPRFLAWPYGFGDPDLDEIASEVGFLRTCTLRAGANEYLDAPPDPADTDRYEMPRYTITARTALRTFRAMADGTYRPDV